MTDKKVKKPEWLKVRGFSGASYREVNDLLKKYNLNTVCQAANCPNRGECFERGTATFLILGPICSRNCRFCDVTGGQPIAVDPKEPIRVAQAVQKLKLKHAVVTSVTRDDLPDGGARQFADTIIEIKRLSPNCTVEVLTPDFKQKPSVVDQIIAKSPDVFNHNIETVPELYPTVRPAANYQGSLNLLKYVSDNSQIRIKSGLMVGLGEDEDQLNRTFDDLADHQVTILTIGQYLAPSVDHLPVLKYWHPDEFDQLAESAKSAGIAKVYSAPLVRSSYLADMALRP